MMDLKIGSVEVVTEVGRGHPPEFFAQRIVDRLISVADTTPEPLKAQALAYKDAMQALVLDGIKRAIMSDRMNRSI